jgi:hypothetical protein
VTPRSLLNTYKRSGQTIIFMVKASSNLGYVSTNLSKYTTSHLRRPKSYYGNDSRFIYCCVTFSEKGHWEESSDIQTEYDSKQNIFCHIKFFFLFLVNSPKITLRLNILNPQKYLVNYRLRVITCSFLWGRKYGNCIPAGDKRELRIR